MIELIMAVLLQTTVETETEWKVTLVLEEVYQEPMPSMQACRMTEIAYKETSILGLNKNQLVMTECKVRES